MTSTPLFNTAGLSEDPEARERWWDPSDPRIFVPRAIGLGWDVNLGAIAVKLGWLPPSGRQTVGINATHITNMYVLDGLITREWDAAWDAFKHLILPTIALASIPFAIIFRITRAAVIDVMDEDYVRTARAKGLHAKTIRGRHVMRNALIPVVTIVGLQIGALLAGAVLTEKVFAFQGIGQALAIGFELRDYPVLQVLIMMAALIYIIVNLLVDIAYAVIDPRVRTK